MNVLFLSSNYHYPQLIGGTETSTHETCLRLSRRGASPAVLCALKPRGALSLGLRLRRHLLREPYPCDRHLGYPVFRVWAPARALAALVPTVQPAVLVVVKNNRELIEAALATGLPVFVYLHSVDFIDFRPYPTLQFIANSRFTAAQLKQCFGREAVVIPPWIDRARYAVHSSRDSVLFVNPTRGKGVETVLALAQARPDIPFVMLESWPLAPDNRRALRARAQALGNITWRSACLDMREVYRATRILIAPSEHAESWGRVASEAQASGIPVIASNRGGLPEAVGPGGLIVPADAPDALARWGAALAQLWDDAAAYQHASAQALAHSQRPDFEPERLIDHLLDYFRTVCPGSADPPPREGAVKANAAGWSPDAR